MTHRPKHSDPGTPHRRDAGSAVHEAGPGFVAQRTRSRTVSAFTGTAVLGVSGTRVIASGVPATVVIAGILGMLALIGGALAVSRAHCAACEREARSSGAAPGWPATVVLRALPRSSWPSEDTNLRGAGMRGRLEHHTDHWSFHPDPSATRRGVTQAAWPPTWSIGTLTTTWGPGDMGWATLHGPDGPDVPFFIQQVHDLARHTGIPTR